MVNLLKERDDRKGRSYRRIDMRHNDAPEVYLEEDEYLDSDIDDTSASERDEFLYAFCVSKTAVFEVSYYTLGGNQHPYFATSACWFNRPKSDWERCGQCQDTLPPGAAKRFYKKWDYRHGEDLTDEEYEELVHDIEELKRVYPYYVAYEFNGKATRTSIPFYAIREKSIEMPRRR